MAKHLRSRVKEDPFQSILATLKPQRRSRRSTLLSFKFKKLMLGLFIAFSIGLWQSTLIFADQVGINKLSSAAAQQVDQLARGVTQCSKLNIGIVYGANNVYSKSYGTSTSVSTVYEWGSVSKPLTALIAMHLVEQGRLDLDRPVWVYTPAQFDYKTMIPDAYESPNPLTLRRLLRHTGGVVHSGNVRKPTMYFQAPDLSYSYSTNGFGVIGDMLWGVEVEYPTMVQRYIAGPIQATSLRTKSFSDTAVSSKFITPGAYIQSDIKDLSRFAIGIMNNEFVSQSTLNSMLDNTYLMQRYGIDYGFGFHVQGTGNDKIAYHSGNNGTPKAHLYVKPFRKFSVLALCTANSTFVEPTNPTQHVLYKLSVNIENALNSFGNPCLNANDCIYPATSTPVPPTATPSATFTPVPPTATSTSTNTAIPPTATRTNTPIPLTATPTATFTPVPPTATSTSTNTAIPPTATRTNTPVPPTATPTSTPTSSSATAITMTIQIAASANDVNQDGSSLSLNSTTLWLGNGASSTSSYAGLRFANLTIPRGATINSARLQVYASQTVWISLSMSITADAAGNSPLFSTSSTPAQRLLTTQKVAHTSNVQWLANTWYSLDEIAPVIQEIVNRPDWQSGNSLSIIIKGTGGSWARKFIGSFDGSASTAPKLVLNYRNTTLQTTGMGLYLDKDRNHLLYLPLIIKTSP